MISTATTPTCASNNAFLQASLPKVPGQVAVYPLDDAISVLIYSIASKFVAAPF